MPESDTTVHEFAQELLLLRMNLHQLQERNQELAILNAIAQDLNSSITLEKAMDTTLRQTVHLLQLKTGWIWLANAETGAIYLAAGYNLPPIFEERPSLLTDTCYCIDKYLKENLDDATNISEITCTRLKDLVEGTEGLRFHASVPLLGRNGKIGIMNVLSEHSQQLSENQLQLLHTIADMLSIAVERARLYESSQQLGVIEERNRLAREIHDTLAQGLGGIALKLETVQAFLEQEKMDKVNTLVSQTLDLTRSNLEEARRSVLDLRATPLQGHNLIEALDQFVQEIAQSNHLIGRLEVVGTYQPLEHRKALGLYRVAQEAIRNIAKHTNCEGYTIKLTFEAQNIHLVIQDKGAGFDLQQPTAGFGLIGMRERVHLLKGQMEVESKSGKGTLVRVIVPLE